MAPHEMGSPQNARVRDYIVGEIEALGLEARVQTDTSVVHGRGETLVARAENVLARLEGNNGDRAVMLMAHYDSAPHSPGASDNGAAVAALLETLRALRSGPPLARDVIFLFSDGEEPGLLGAEAFQQHHPWAADIALVLNFEARGARGPSIMFETGAGTGPLMRRFGSLAPRPVASSYSYDVYRLMPNFTDFSVFKDAGKPGFNFAYIGDVAAYHATLDTVERMDPRSLQHHGTYALALSRGLTEVDLANLPAGSARVYFNLPLLGLVVYPSALALPLAVLAVLLAAWVLYLGFARERLRPGPVVLGLLVVPLAVAATAAIVALYRQGLFSALVAGRGLLAHPPLFRLGLVLVAVALFAAATKKLGVADVSAGAAIWWLVLAGRPRSTCRRPAIC